MEPLREYIFFWGCVIPARFPFIEKSTRLLLDRLGVRFREVDGFTCCPEKFFVETFSKEAWYLTAARNLALAEAAGGDLLVACNGCYSTFRSAIRDFYSSSELRREVTNKLAGIGLEYNFRSGVRHLVDLLHDNIGPEVIERKVIRSLEGMRVGVHYGCQFLRPSPSASLDDPARPGKLDRLVESLGATSLDYYSKQMCCGESLRRSGNPKDSMAAARVKLLELDEMGADAMVVVCPACFMQFDVNQNLVQKQREGLSIPVFYLTELMGIALGIDPTEMALDMHRVDTRGFFARLEELEGIRLKIPAEFDLRSMRTCVTCESCANDCPVSQVDDSFVPHEVIRRVLSGDVEGLFNGPDIWKCLECGTCQELCPNSFGMIRVFKQAKRMALERGIAPPETVQGIEMFKKTGVLGKAKDRTRTRLGLSPAPASADPEEISRLLWGITEGKE